MVGGTDKTEWQVVLEAQVNPEVKSLKLTPYNRDPESFALDLDSLFNSAASEIFLRAWVSRTVQTVLRIVGWDGQGPKDGHSKTRESGYGPAVLPRRGPRAPTDFPEPVSIRSARDVASFPGRK